MKVTVLELLVGQSAASLEAFQLRRDVNLQFFAGLCTHLWGADPGYVIGIPVPSLEATTRID